jgi:hypothetical protein
VVAFAAVVVVAFDAVAFVIGVLAVGVFAEVAFAEVAFAEVAFRGAVSGVVGVAVAAFAFVVLPVAGCLAAALVAGAFAPAALAAADFTVAVVVDGDFAVTDFAGADFAAGTLALAGFATVACGVVAARARLSPAEAARVGAGTCGTGAFARFVRPADVADPAGSTAAFRVAGARSAITSPTYAKRARGWRRALQRFARIRNVRAADKHATRIRQFSPDRGPTWPNQTPQARWRRHRVPLCDREGYPPTRWCRS